MHSIGKDVSLIKGGGAAGGIGAGMHAFCNAQIKSGIENILEMLNIHSFIKESDLVITGEGLFDKQTLEGKVVKGVLDRCRKLDKPAAIICGNTTLSKEEIKKGYQKYFKTIKTNDITIDDSMKNAYKYLVERSKELMEEFTGEVI